jgi:hypothetical protein
MPLNPIWVSQTPSPRKIAAEIAADFMTAFAEPLQKPQVAYRIVKSIPLKSR